MFGKGDYRVLPVLFLLASAILSAFLLVVGVPRLVIAGEIKFGSHGTLMGGVFPFPWYLLIPTIAIVAGTIISVFKTTVKENSNKMKMALGIMGATLLASISYFVYVADFWYTNPTSHYGLPATGSNAFGFTTPYTAYPPPLGYSQYLYYIITAAFLTVTVILLLRIALNPRKG